MFYFFTKFKKIDTVYVPYYKQVNIQSKIKPCNFGEHRSTKYVRLTLVLKKNQSSVCALGKSILRTSFHLVFIAIFILQQVWFVMKRNHESGTLCQIFGYFQCTRPRLSPEDPVSQEKVDQRLKLGVNPYPQFLPLPLYGIPGFPLSCYGYRPPEAHRNGSIASLRLKAREYEAAIEMQNIFKTWF